MLTITSSSAGIAVAEIDKTYYRQLGQRIAERRKAVGMTQVELAGLLGVAQQTMAHYEGGTLRIAVALLAPISETLNISFEELIGSSTKRGTNKRGPASTLEKQMAQISQLPRAKQKFVMDMLNTVIQQA